MLNRKVDFAVILSVKNANPNGDPLNENCPRTHYDYTEGREGEMVGEISDVCLKRKMRDRLMEENESILVQSEDRKKDGCTSIKNRAYQGIGRKSFSSKETTESETVKKACDKWFDVRAFGQLFAFTKEEDDDNAVSIGIRGPVSVQSAFSVDPINITSIQITKSVNGQDDKSKKSSDTMGMKHRVDYGVYVFFGSINPQLAEKTGFSDDDANRIKKILPRLFENDASSARPEGSMEVKKVFWWQHNCNAGQYSSAKVHKSLTVNSDGSYKLSNLDGLQPEEIDGF